MADEGDEDIAEWSKLYECGHFLWYNKVTGQRITIHDDADGGNGAVFDGTQEQRAVVDEIAPQRTTIPRVSTAARPELASKTAPMDAPLGHEPSGAGIAGLDPSAVASWLQSLGASATACATIEQRGINGVTLLA